MSITERRYSSNEANHEAVRTCYPRNALVHCLAAMDAMRTQIDQMRGMFKDEDGRIAQACADHFEAAQLAGAALKACIQEG